MYKKIISIILIIIAITCSIQAQNNDGTKIYRDSVKGMILDNPSYVKFRVGENLKTKDKNNRIQIKDIFFESGHLKIDYLLFPFFRPERKFNMFIQPKLRIGKSLLFLAPFEHLGGQIEPAYATNKKKKDGEKIKSIIWKDFMENYPIFRDKEFHLVLEGALHYSYPCEEKIPEFLKNPMGDTNFKYHWKKQWPHFAGIVLGGGFLGLSAVLSKKAELEYDEYQKAIFQEKDIQATELFVKTRSYSNWSTFLSKTATYIFIADAGVWLGRYIVYRIRKKHYKDYNCEERLSLNLNSSYEEIGIKLAWNF